MNNKHDLTLLLRSRFPIITIETHEEIRALDMLDKAAGSLNKPLHLWSITEGLKLHKYSSSSLKLLDTDHPVNAHEHEPVDALRKIKSRNTSDITAFLDFHTHFTNPVAARLIKEISQKYHLSEQTLVFISHELALPSELMPYSASFTLSLPNKDQIKQLLEDEAKLWVLKHGDNVKADSAAMELLVDNLVGLTVSDTQRFLRSAIHDDGAITHDDIPEIQKAKYALIGQEGLVSFEYDTSRFSDIGGMKRLKEWLEKRRPHFTGSDGALDSPKGILLVGVQGCGKSLTAKAVAGVFGVPLLRLDFGVLYNKFFGETEKNIRKALALAKAMSPCVLWIDEIEKGIATGDYDSGTSRRVLGTLLTWMSESQQRVFIVATANDIQALPPELIRKGRLDEIFFVDLPTHDVRREIFQIHLSKRKQDSANFDLTVLATQSEGFSGAEIEQAVVGACYSALADNTPFVTRHISEELSRTKPISVVMDEKINALRVWAKERTVSVDE